MSAVFDAHLRMLATLPVRTVERRMPYPSVNEGRPRPEVIQKRRQFIKKNLPHMTLADIALELGVGRKCVVNHARAMRREDRKNRRRKCK